jgi:hypothetical protein
MIARLLIPILSVLLQLAAALLAIGLPDLRLAAGFFVDYPTVASSLAAAQLLVWALIALGGLWAVALAIGEMHHTPGRVRRRFWEGSVLVMGILILMGGVARDLTYQVPMQGGTIVEAQQALEALHPGGR